MPFQLKNRTLLIALSAFALASTNAFVIPTSHKATSTVELSAIADDNNNNNSNSDRRSFLASGLAVATSIVTTQVALAEQAPETRQGIPVTAFNGLIFNYRGGSFGGLDASTIDEPSISYEEFNKLLKEGQVEFVEFEAPDGDVCRATLKAKDGGSKQPPIRIGEGFPIEQHDGYSSPAFAVRAVKNAGVPYKFTVPALAKFQSS